MSRGPIPPKPRKSRRRLAFAAISILVGGSAYVGWVLIPQLKPRAAVASGYMARVACACHFIGGRSLDSCANDKEPGMEAVRLSADPATRRVTASVPLIVSSSATHTQGLGCVLDK